jgi:hypothetical protein
MFAGPSADDDRGDLYVIRRVLQPARTLGGSEVVTLADDHEPTSVDELRGSVREVNGMFRDSEYAGAVAALPTAITHARTAAARLDGTDQVAANEQLAQIYQTAGLILIQLGKDDLAYHALGLAMEAGRQAGDEMLVAAAVCGENWLLTRQGRFDEAERTALTTAEAVEPSFSRSPSAHLGTWGWLNVRAQVACAGLGATRAPSDATTSTAAAAVNFVRM